MAPQFRRTAIAYGGDYNPEQWSREIQEEDAQLMREAGVNLVSLGIFAWVFMEPAEGQYEFGWLDEIMDRLHANGIGVDLATPTAAVPAWFTRKYPHTRPVTRDGIQVGFGSRQHACPSAPEYRSATARLAEALAVNYQNHPALKLWHVHNEYGAPLGECYCEQSRLAFIAWLQRRYGELASLNSAWGTAFWGQRYTDWDEIDVPRYNHTAVNPAQRLDFARFSSSESLDCFILQRDILHRVTPSIPVTTNFMTVNCKSMDLWKWGREVDVVANDHYLMVDEPDPHINLSMAADLARSFGGGKPWVLMEHSTSAVTWQPRNIAKRPNELRRNSLTHLARGADGLMFFQWRQSRFGAEKFHSAMVPQAGTATQIWHDVVALGTELSTLDSVAGTKVAADVAIVWDWESYWALELEWRPTIDLSFRERIDAYYAALWRCHVTSDFVHPEADLSKYKLVVAPSLYLLSEAGSKNLRRFVELGGHLLVSYFSGIVDGNDTVPPGPYPGALRETLGLWTEEFHPLRAGEEVALDGGTGKIWSERIHLAGATAQALFRDGPDAGHPAITRHALGDGVAWYIATAPSHLDRLIETVVDTAAVTRFAGLPDCLEAVRRGDHIFVLNHSESPADAFGTTVPAGGCVLLAASTFS